MHKQILVPPSLSLSLIYTRSLDTIYIQHLYLYLYSVLCICSNCTHTFCFVNSIYVDNQLVRAHTNTNSERQVQCIHLFMHIHSCLNKITHHHLNFQKWRNESRCFDLSTTSSAHNSQFTLEIVQKPGLVLHTTALQRVVSMKRGWGGGGVWKNLRPESRIKNLESRWKNQDWGVKRQENMNFELQTVNMSGTFLL